MNKLKLNTPNKDWVDKPTLTIEELEEFQSNCVAYAQNNLGNYSAPNIDAHTTVLLIKILSELRKIAYHIEDNRKPAVEDGVHKNKKG